MAVVRWGLFGASNIARRVAADLAVVPGAEVAAIASRDPERARVWAQENNVPRVHESYEALVADPEIDAIYVSTVHSWHYAAAKLSLEHGKSVVVEKPFTIHLRDAEELVRIAQERQLFLMEAMWTPFNPLLADLKSLVDRGEIGDVIQIRANLGPIPGLNPRLFDRTVGGGVLLECGVYPLAFAQYFLGRPSEVRAASHLTAGGVDDATSVQLGFDSGASAVLSCSATHRIASGLTSNGAVIGTKGWIDVGRDMFYPQAATVHRPDRDPELLEWTKPGNGYIEEMTEATAAIAAGRKESSSYPLAETLLKASVLDACLEQVGVVYPEAPVLAGR